MTRRRLAVAASALLGLDLLLQPASPLPPAAELLFGAGLLLLVPRPAVARAVAALWLLLALLALAEFALELQFGRPLRLADDVRLVGVLWEVLWQVLPSGVGALALALALALPAACFALARLATRALLQLAPGRRRLGALCAALALLAPALPGPPLSTAASERLLAQFARYREGEAKRARLREQLARPDPIPAPPPGAALGRRDVLVLFVESYGRAALAQAGIREQVRPALAALARRARALGLASASGLIRSPTAGGRSWLAHATLLTGLWIDEQASYALLTRSRPRTLAHLFAASGHRTRLLAPAVARPWPQAAAYGFERVLTAPELGYAGPRFGWPPVPDQFALAALFRRELRPRPRPPVFAVVLLASSHSPFAPLPPLVPWEELGDGSRLKPPKDADPPAALWLRPARLKRAYARAIARVLATLESFLADRLAPCTLLIVVGDHEPPGLVLGGPPGDAVPIHLLSDDPRLLRPFLARGLRPGLWPDLRPPSLGMDALFALLEEAHAVPASRHCPLSGAPDPAPRSRKAAGTPRGASATPQAAAPRGPAPPPRGDRPGRPRNRDGGGGRPERPCACAA